MNLPTPTSGLSIPRSLPDDVLKVRVHAGYESAAGGKRKAPPERGQATPQSQGTAPGAAHKKGPRQSRGQSSEVSRPPPGPVCGGRPPGLGWYDGPRAGYIGGGRLFSAYHKSLQFARRWMGGVAPTWRLRLATDETAFLHRAPPTETPAKPGRLRTGRELG